MSKRRNLEGKKESRLGCRRCCCFNFELLFLIILMFSTVCVCVHVYVLCEDDDSGEA